jgi:hypothetical protein
MGRLRRSYAGSHSDCLQLAWMGEVTVLLMAATAIVIALLFFWLSGRSRKRTGIPAGEVFYQDLVGQPFAARDLRSQTLGISGNRLFDQNCRRDSTSRIEEIEPATGSR